jgi:hypothetical protein
MTGGGCNSLMTLRQRQRAHRTTEQKQRCTSAEGHLKSTPTVTYLGDRWLMDYGAVTVVLKHTFNPIVLADCQLGGFWISRHTEPIFASFPKYQLYQLLTTGALPPQ